MSLLTRCPACTTVYRVVPDQLRISQGWVKCGQCGDIFDATQHLIQTATVPLDVPAVPPPVVPDELADASHDLAPEGEGTQDETESEVPDVQPVEDTALEQDESSLQLADSEPALESDAALAKPQQSGADEDVNLPSETPAEEPLEALPSPLTDSDDRRDGFEQVSFMQRAAGSSFWQRRAVKALLWLFAIWLGVGLAGQGVVQERDRLAAWHPELKPVLQVMCQVLACSVGPLQQIESVAVDSAAFYTLGADRYRLSFTLKNSARMAVALPSIELTLTDALDQAVIRRVLSAAELAVDSDRLGPAAEWPVTMVLKVNPGAGMPKVVGYRLLAFYP
jgi:predicted Zn finger-like uncharacterized protein